MKLAIIGAGSSGLVTLKYALDYLPDWQIVCYEKTDQITGAWGRMPSGFTSTSTKYTTQFACFRRFDSSVDGREFFRGHEFGDYLEAFAARFDLKKHIRLTTRVNEVSEQDGRWRLRLDDGFEFADALILCIGLTDRPPDPPEVSGKRVVVMGGGESAVDLAHRLCQNNQVFLSLRSGIRVSPRYHPIRGVPSDFLRTRLMESIQLDLRNRLGLLFVKARMRYERLFQTLTGAAIPERTRSHRENKKRWTLKLTEAAKDQLFNMFHNKSDEFLDDVAAGRIRIVGEPIDEQSYREFDGQGSVRVCPDQVFRCLGYRSSLGQLSAGSLSLRDFHLASLHNRYENLFLVGFARPIIGNIPSMSELQARYAVGILAGRFERPQEVDTAAEFAALRARYPKIDVDNIYPVEYIPYCDLLARRMGCSPSLKRLGFRRWLKVMLTPASTSHYLTEHFDGDFIDRQQRYLPGFLVGLLLMVKLFEVVSSAFASLCL